MGGKVDVRARCAGLKSAGVSSARLGYSCRAKRTFSGRAVVVFVYECVEPVCVVYWRVDVHRRRPVSRFHVAWLSSLNTRILDKKNKRNKQNIHLTVGRGASL